MAKSARNFFLLLAALLMAVPPGVFAAKKKAPVTRIEPAKKKRKPATPRPKPAPRATPEPALRLKPENFRLLTEGEIPLSAKGAIVIDAMTGAAIYEKDADTQFYPASTTKIMTALLIIEAGDLDHEVECTLEDSQVGEASLGLKPGQRFTRRHMLFGLMLKSANDVAHALGRDNAGTAEAFAEKMTERARELGATHTQFRNANGLHHPAHFTTARDLALIGRAAMQQPFFRQIVSTLEYQWNVEPGNPPLVSRNRLLAEFPGSTGVKTGYTNPAQHTFVGAAVRDGREMICAVLHSTRQGKWEDSKLLLTYGFDHPVGSVATK